LDIVTINSINRNKDFYQQVSDETNAPWELLAAIHYRETGFGHSNPYNGQGIFQFVNGDGGPYPPGPVSDDNFIEQLTYMANRIQDDYVHRSDLPYTTRALKKTNEDAYRIKDVLFSYNGRAGVYASQAADLGFDSSTEPYEGSPYVMNRFDCDRENMGIITRDYGGLDGLDYRYGAYTMYHQLVGDGANNTILDIASGEDFQPGNIISDSVFTNNNSMTVAEIQAFLAEQVSVCDTDGLLFSYNNVQRKDVDPSNPPPYDCLKGYVNSNTGQTAGEVIKEAADEYKINPQVILVMIETQHGLVTDDWPWNYQYQQAGCSPQSAQSCYNVTGFKNQINNLASTLKNMYNPVNNNAYMSGSTYEIPYSSTASCGGKNITIANNATAAIYNYTGYQPNPAALANPYGYGDSCSVKNNLYFYTYFNNWFEVQPVIKDVNFIPMKYPRLMTLSRGLYKTDLRDHSSAYKLLEEAREIEFSMKTTIDGDLYLRTTHDTVNDNPYGILFSDLDEIIEERPVADELDYIPMLYPRPMTLSRELYKTNLLDNSNAYKLLDEGREIEFSMKTTVNGQLYLRTTHDTVNDNPYGILFSDLDEII